MFIVQVTRATPAGITSRPYRHIDGSVATFETLQDARAFAGALRDWPYDMIAGDKCKPAYRAGRML